MVRRSRIDRPLQWGIIALPFSPFIMAGLDGSPFGSTDVLGLYFYRTAFGNQSAGVQDFGMGSALAVLIFSFILIAAATWTVYLRRREIEL